jgi:hypothetical protein
MRRQPERSPVLQSLIACFFGFAICMGMLCLYFGVSEGVFLPLPLETVFASVGYFFGWLIYLLPVAIAWRPHEHWDNRALVCALGVVVAGILTTIETFLLTTPVDPKSGLRFLYVFTGTTGAWAASYCMIGRLRGRGYIGMAE